MQTRKFVLVMATLFVAGCYSKQDESDALKVAAKIHSQLQQSNFAGIYNEASPIFKNKGDESKFVREMTHFFEVIGDLRKITPVAYQSRLDTNAGRHYILLSDLEFERGPCRERMVFTRSPEGRMELWELSIEPIQ